MLECELLSLIVVDYLLSLTVVDTAGNDQEVNQPGPPEHFAQKGNFDRVEVTQE